MDFIINAFWYLTLNSNIIIINCCFYLRIQHGLGQFHLGDSQNYHLIYEANNYCLKVIVTQLNKVLSPQQQATSFELFLELMIYLEESIHSVINLYIPSTKLPLLYVVCPLCDVTTPHILLESARKISLNLPSLCCGEKDKPVIIPQSSYLPFSDTLTYEAYSKNIFYCYCYCVAKISSSIFSKKIAMMYLKLLEAI